MTEKRANSLPSLNALRVLDALARCGSLRGAAAELGVVPGAVRQQLAGLEDHFRTPLIIRQGGRLSLSSAGKRLADAVGVALTIIGRAAEEISSDGKRDCLKLGVPVPMATAWFLPRLPRLLAQVPTLEIDIVSIPVTAALSDMPELDAIIVGGEYQPLPDVIATRFMADEFGPVMSAGLAETASLESLTAIVARNVLYLWDDWFRESGNAPLRFRKRKEFEDLPLAIAAAKAGLGATIAPRSSVESELASGALQAPLGFVERPAGFRLCCRVADSARGPIAALQSWLIDEGKLPLQAVQTADKALEFSGVF